VVAVLERTDVAERGAVERRVGERRLGERRVAAAGVVSGTPPRPERRKAHLFLGADGPDGARVAALMPGAARIESEGRAFAVETRYLGRDPAQRVEDAVTRAILAALADEYGLEESWRQIREHLANPDRFERNLQRLLDGFEADLQSRD